VPHKFFYISRVPEPVTFLPECSISYRFNRPVYSEAIRVAEYIRFRLESAYPTRAYTLKFESLPNVINTRKCVPFPIASIDPFTQRPFESLNISVSDESPRIQLVRTL
jgi:hypothetical protein